MYIFYCGWIFPTESSSRPRVCVSAHKNFLLIYREFWWLNGILMPPPSERGISEHEKLIKIHMNKRMKSCWECFWIVNGKYFSFFCSLLCISLFSFFFSFTCSLSSSGRKWKARKRHVVYETSNVIKGRLFFHSSIYLRIQNAMQFSRREESFFFDFIVRRRRANVKTKISRRRATSRILMRHRLDYPFLLILLTRMYILWLIFVFGFTAQYFFFGCDDVVEFNGFDGTSRKVFRRLCFEICWDVYD